MTEPSKAAMDGPELIDVFAGDDATPEYLLGWREGFRLGVAASATALQSAQAEIARLREALGGMLNRYVGLVNSGDAGFWDPENEPEVRAARTALETRNG